MNYTMYAYGCPYRSDFTWHNFNHFPAYLSPTRLLSSSFEIRINSWVVLMVLISVGSIELIFDGTYASYELPFSPKLTVELLFSITKRLSRRDPSGFPAVSREIIYSPSLCCDSYVPTANSKLFISWNYGVGNILFHLGSFEVGDALPLRSRNVQMGFLGHYLSTRFSV